MINKNKETIEKMEEEIDKLTYHKNHETCPECNLCGTCEILLKPLKTQLKATIKTSIEWCEDEIEFLNSKENGLLKFILWHNQRSLLPYDWFDYEHPRILKRLEQLTTHLKWLKEQEKN